MTATDVATSFVMAAATAMLLMMMYEF